MRFENGNLYVLGTKKDVRLLRYYSKHYHDIVVRDKMYQKLQKLKDSGYLESATFKYYEILNAVSRIIEGGVKHIYVDSNISIIVPNDVVCSILCDGVFLQYSEKTHMMYMMIKVHGDDDASFFESIFDNIDCSEVWVANIDSLKQIANSGNTIVQAVLDGINDNINLNVPWKFRFSIRRLK